MAKVFLNAVGPVPWRDFGMLYIGKQTVSSEDRFRLVSVWTRVWPSSQYEWISPRTRQKHDVTMSNGIGTVAYSNVKARRDRNNFDAIYWT